MIMAITDDGFRWFIVHIRFAKRRGLAVSVVFLVMFKIIDFSFRES